MAALRRGRERWAADERILGSGPFVEVVREGVDLARRGSTEDLTPLGPGKSAGSQRPRHCMGDQR